MQTNYVIKVLKKPDVTELAGEKVMIDFDTGKFFMLTGSANDIWDMLEDEITLEKVVSKLLDEYEVEKEVCTKEVLEFIQKLSEIGFVSLEKTA